MPEVKSFAPEETGPEKNHKASASKRRGRTAMHKTRGSAQTTYQKLDRALRVSTFALVFLSYWAMQITPWFGPGVLMVPIALFLVMPLFERLDERFPPYRYLTSVVTVVFCLTLPFMAGVFQLLIVLSALIMFIQMYLVLHKKSARRYKQLFLMCFFLLFLSSLMNPGSSVGLMTIAFLAGGTFCFLLLHLREEYASAFTENIIYEDGEVPSGPARNTPFQRSGQWEPIWWYGGKVALVCVLLTMSIFLLTPRLKAGFLGASDSDLDSVVGISTESVETEDRGTLRVTGDQVMAVEFPEESGGRYSGKMLWRSTSYDVYQDGQWTQSLEQANFEMRTETTEDYGRMRGMLVRTGMDSDQQDLVRQRIEIVDAPERGIPCLPRVQRVESPDVNLNWHRIRDGTVQVVDENRRMFMYEVWSDVGIPGPEELLNAPANYEETLPPEDYERLTHCVLMNSSRSLTDEVVGDAETPYEIVKAVEQFFRSDAFEYREVPSPMGITYPLDSFLQQRREGYCRMFATAMAQMLRHKGIPTRVVSGYRGGKWDAATGRYVVLQDMGHLWLEVYFSGYGWIPFDPSPPVESQLSPMAEDATAANTEEATWGETLAKIGTGFLALFDPQNLSEFRDFLIYSFWTLFGEDTSQTGVGPGRRLLWSPIAGVVSIMLLIIVFFRFGRRPLSEYNLTPDQERAVRLFQHLRKQLSKMGIECTDKSARQVLDDLDQINRRLVGPAAKVVGVYNEVRFGGRPLPPQRYNELKSTIRHLAG